MWALSDYLLQLIDWLNYQRWGQITDDSVVIPTNGALTLQWCPVADFELCVQGPWQLNFKAMDLLIYDKLSQRVSKSLGFWREDRA